ncbi:MULTISPECIES: hypothetical protein [Pasteurellaceae]|uniref:hypothetical protein n=1 Tax=Pasteurellaceae TaxID=712 RepID=UPI003562892C
MGNQRDKFWMIHLEKKADDEFLMHFKGLRKIVIGIILVALWILSKMPDIFSFVSP